MKKKCKVVMLPTEKSSLFTTETADGNITLDYRPGEIWHNNTPELTVFIPYHLYLISDDEITEGDYATNGEDLIQLESSLQILEAIDDGFKKVIASTDSELTTECESFTDCIHNCSGYDIESSHPCIGKSLPIFSEDFIKAYVNANGKIDEVMVEYCCQRCGVSNNKHKMSCKDSYLQIQTPKLRDDNTVILTEAKTFIHENDLRAALINLDPPVYINRKQATVLLDWINENKGI